MMRGFQNWSRNSNQITFDSFFGQKTDGNWQNTRFSPFWQLFLAQKGVKCYLIWIRRPDLESSHHFAYFRHIFDMIFAFWFFDLPCIFKNLKLNSRPLKVLEIDFSCTIELSVSETMGNHSTCFQFPKLVFFEQPYWGCTVYTRHNFQIRLRNIWWYLESQRLIVRWIKFIHYALIAKLNIYSFHPF